MIRRKTLGQIAYEAEYRIRGREDDATWMWVLESPELRNFYERWAAVVKAAVLDEQRAKKEKTL